MFSIIKEEHVIFHNLMGTEDVMHSRISQVQEDYRAHVWNLGLSHRAKCRMRLPKANLECSLDGLKFQLDNKNML